MNTEMSAGGKAGVLVSQSALIYGLLAKSWTDTSFGRIDGWQFGGGITVKLPNAPLFVDLQYRDGHYDTADIFGVDSRSSQARVGIIYKFTTK
jgi:hypothetical protein